MNRKYLLRIALLLLLPFFTKAQLQLKQLDSLHTALKNVANDTIKMITLSDLTFYFAENNRDSAMFFCEAGMSIASKINQPLWVARFLLYKSNLVLKQDNFSLCLKLCNEALAITQDEKNEKNAYIPKDYEFASEPKKYRMRTIRSVFHELGNTWSGAGNKEKAIEYFKKEIQVSESLNTRTGSITSNMNIGNIYQEMDKLDSAMVYSTRGLANANLTGRSAYTGFMLCNIGTVYFKKGQIDSAKHYYQQSLNINKEQNNLSGEIEANISFAKLYQKLFHADSMKYYANAALQLATQLKSPTRIGIATKLISDVWKMQGNADSALVYLTFSKSLGDSLNKNREDKLIQFQNANFEEQLRLEKGEQDSIAAKNKIRTIALLVGLGLLSILVFVFYRNNKQKQKANAVLQEQKQKVETTLHELKSTQTQLIQSEKMASLGELTAGIAHEIQNPLNFVNNFSEVNKELLVEMKEEMRKGNLADANELADDIISNEEKINHHGKRADAIVKGMLQHSRKSEGVKEPTDINTLCDEYLRLAYHGLRAKDKSFNADFKTDFDNSIGKINIIPQDIGRVLLNLINNAFYAVDERQKITKENLPTGQAGYQPSVFLSSKKSDDKVILTVKDNGNGIPQNIVDKIFQPFFTTKPTGQGTGLGLSLSYDIIKAHGGEIKVETKEGEGTTFIIELSIV
jgi:two-component system NtrC family sensor kinase